MGYTSPQLNVGCELLADRLSRLRRQAGLSYHQLSDRTYINIAYLHALEQGRKSKPSRDVLIRLAFGLGLDLESADDLLRQAGHLPLLRLDSPVIATSPVS